MSIISTARIARRIDDCPTERLPRIPAQVAAAYWTSIDRKPARPTVPSWASTVSHPDERDQAVVMYGSPLRRLEVGAAGFTSSTTVRCFRLDDATGPGTPIVEMGSDDLTAGQARQLAALLVEHADLVDGRQPQPQPTPGRFRTAVAAFRLGRRVEALVRAVTR